MTTLKQVFETALANKIAVPRMRLGNYLFKWSKNKQVIYITDGGSYEEAVYYGKISFSHIKGADLANQLGFFTPSQATNSEKILEIVTIMKDVGPAAKAYGQRTGTCCICGRALINKESIRLMIGPICLEKYGFSFADLLAEDEEDGQIRIADI